MAAILECQTAKNSKTASYKKHPGTKLDQFQQVVLEISSFSCLCYFSNGPWRSSCIVNWHKFEIVPLKASYRSFAKKWRAKNRFNFISTE